MKTLDEVIKAMNWCTDLDQSGCNACPYADSDQIICFKDDALHYLEEYRAGKKAIDAAIARYDEAVKNCERAENIYKQKQKAAEDALWICKEDKNELTALRAYWKEMHKDVRQKAEVNNEDS